MNRRSFLAGLFGVAASGSLVCWIKSSDAVSLLTGVEAPSDIRPVTRLPLRTARPSSITVANLGGCIAGRMTGASIVATTIAMVVVMVGMVDTNGFGRYGGYGSRRVCRALSRSLVGIGAGAAVT